ncbi:MAG: 3-deoxy-D-manno-octulosonic acid transferase [Mucilaginibacter polytrichastri]|nr:3-deoxy-D-manno-octulosonic acid transferase [Mucilaginibacter polytrichastri]
MVLLYNTALFIYLQAAKLLALRSKKARLWVHGQRQRVPELDRSLWFHFASLGEFEQGRSVLVAARQQYAGVPVLVTFFSPSGYEVRKNTPLADHVLYLPLDSAKNARRFIAAVKPVAAFFTKYEYWYHYYTTLKEQRIPLYLFSAIYRPGQPFFRWYGGLHREMLRCITRIFVQNEESQILLGEIGITNVIVSGDTRFDRVRENAAQVKQLPEIEIFRGENSLLIGGSTWPKDEELLFSLLKIPQAEGWRMVIAPHETDKARIDTLMEKAGPAAIPYSTWVQDPQREHAYRILVIDNIGMLSSLYQYGRIALIGGGFGAGIHNTLEAAAFGLPVIFGPNYHKFQEAKDLIATGAGFCVTDDAVFTRIFSALQNEATLQAASAKAREYVGDHSGATDIIIRHL